MLFKNLYCKIKYILKIFLRENRFNDPLNFPENRGKPVRENRRETETNYGRKQRAKNAGTKQYGDGEEPWKNQSAKESLS